MLERFDLDFAAALTGDAGTADAVRGLLDANVLISRVGTSFRFHPLLRELAVDELRSGDPERFVDLHRRAATLWAERGQIDAALAHLRAIGDADAAFELVVRPAVSHLDQGRAPQMRRWLQLLPAGWERADGGRLLDLADAYFVAGDLERSDTWCDRSARVVPPDDPGVTARRLAVAVVRGDVEQGRRLSVTAGLGPGRRRPTPSGRVSPMERRSALIAARIHLLDEDFEAAGRLLGRDLPLDVDDGARDVAVPALRARLLAATGDVRAAHQWAQQALEAARRRGWRTSAATFEAWAADSFALIGQGQLQEAAVAVDAVHDHADRLGYPYGEAFAAALRLELHALEHGRAATAGLADELRPNWDDERSTALHRLLDERRARAYASAGRLADALDLATPLGLARPFLHGGGDLERRLSRLPPGLLEPLVGAVRQRPAPPARLDRRPALSPREREVLTLLPAHLGYGAIAERSFVSVNTIKTNLKSIYRKLGTRSRAETVTAARALGLLPRDGAA